MKQIAFVTLCLASTLAAAHPGHGQPGWIHFHAAELVLAGLAVTALIVAAVVVKRRRKARSK